jgi:hypothetical protein
VELPAFLRFEPVPVRGRHDGWTARRQRLFILGLARGDGPAAAARQVGLSRQTAYALRRRCGAESFAAAWDAAVDFSIQARRAGRLLPPSDEMIETLLVPRFYRGRLVGYLMREDLAGARRTLARLDRLAQSALADEGFDFDALVDRAAGGAEADKADGIAV